MVQGSSEDLGYLTEGMDMAGRSMEASAALTAASAVVDLTMVSEVAVLTTVLVVVVSSEPSLLAGRLDRYVDHCCILELHM